MAMQMRSAIVTGSSRGIGRAIAELLAEMGARVVISSRKQEACELVADSINEQHGAGTAIAVAASISDKAALESLVERTLSAFGQVDVLVCNAATNPYYGPMAGISDEQFLKILTNNVVANNWLIQMCAPRMREQGGGSVIVISSIGGLLGSETIGAYNISKAADLQLIRNLAVEFGRDRIRVNGIAPGVIRTDFARAIWEKPGAEAAFAKMAPLARIGEPVEIAGAAAFLAAGASAYYNENDAGSALAVKPTPGEQYPVELIFGQRPPADPHVTNANVGFNKVRTWTANADLEQPIGEGTLSVVGNYRYSRQNFGNDCDGTPVDDCR